MGSVVPVPMTPALLAAGRAAVHGLGAPAALGLLVPMEAGVPIPVPADLVMLTVGERVQAGAFPPWLAVVLLPGVAPARTAAPLPIFPRPRPPPLLRPGP